MNKAKKILALLMALCMALGVFSVPVFAADLQTEINAAAAGSTITWGGTSGPVVISKDITIVFEPGSVVWSSEATPAITIKDGVKVTLDGVTAGVTSYDNFNRYDAMDLPGAYLNASVPAIRVQNNAELNLKNAVVTGGEAKVVSTDIYVPVGAGVETYNNSAVNIENSIVFGSWGVENTPSTTVKIGATSIVAGYMDATNCLYKTSVADGSYKLTSKEFVEAFINFELDEEQAPIADQMFGDRVWVVVEDAPTALANLEADCLDGVATISFNAEDTLWVPTTITVDGLGTKTLALDEGKYKATYTEVESGDYDVAVDYQLRTDLGDAANTLNDFIDDFARDYWPDLNDNINTMVIDHILEVADDELAPQLKDAYKLINDFYMDYMVEDSPLWEFRNDFYTIRTQLHYIVGDDVVVEVTGNQINPKFQRGIGDYNEILNYFKALKNEDGIVAKTLYIINNYEALWNEIAGEEGETLYVHIANIYNVLSKEGMLADMLNTIENNPDVAELVGDSFDQVTDLKALLKDLIDGVDSARDMYNELVGGDEFQDYLAFASEEYLEEGNRLFTNIKDYYAPDFEGTKLLVKEAVIEDSVEIENVLSPVTLTYDANGGIGAPEAFTGRGAIALSTIKPTREGFLFKGWATAADATVEQYNAGDNFILEADTTLFAVWEEEIVPTDVTLTYDANGGIGAPEAFTGKGAIALSTIKPTREGFFFRGWATAADAIVEQYNAGDNFILEADTTLFAVWAEETVSTDGVQTEVTVEGSGKVYSSTIQTRRLENPEVVYSYNTFTLTAVDVDDVFVFWKNTETGKVWSYDAEITINPVNAKKLTAVFMADEEGWDTFAFINEYGASKDFGNSLEDAPEVPDTLYSGTLKLADPAWTLVAEKGNFIKIYRVNYVVNDEAAADITVTVNGGSLWDLDGDAPYAETTKGYKFKDAVYVAAEDQTDSFSYWKDQNGKIVSYAKNYSFVATRDVELTAVSNASGETSDVALNTYFVLDTESGEMNIFAERSIAAGSTKKVIEIGSLVAIKGSIADEDIKIGTSGVSRSVDKLAGSTYAANGTYWTSLSAATVERIRNGIASNGYVLRARGYIVVQDTVTGAVETIYDPVVTPYNF